MSLKRGESYSQDLRDRVLDTKGPIRSVADRFGVSPSYVSKATSRFRLTEERGVKPRGGQRPALLKDLEAEVRAQVAACADATLEELRAWLLEVHGVKISMGALWNTLHRYGLRFKKKPARRRAGANGREGGPGSLAARTARA